jgi:hypothetical protein
VNLGRTWRKLRHRRTVADVMHEAREKIGAKVAAELDNATTLRPKNEFGEWYYGDKEPRAWCWIDPPSDALSSKGYVPRIEGWKRPIYFDFEFTDRERPRWPLVARRNGKTLACDCGDPDCDGGLTAT